MISIIIPVLNEACALPATLASLQLQEGSFETIVVDGGSSDNSVAIARAAADVTVIDSARGRASQMNAGARVATGSILLFLHADTQLPAGALALLSKAAQSGSWVWGGFRQQFSGQTASLRAISWLHNWRCGITGIFYGDQAMFVSRDFFTAVGGFPSGEHLEDIRLSEALGARISPLFFREQVTTDSRKFEQLGSLRCFTNCLMILISYELRLPLAGKSFFAAIR